MNNFELILIEIIKIQHNLENSNKQEAAKSLKEDWCNEVKEIRMCIDCYYSRLTSENNPDYFTLVCKKPHLLVYVQESKADGSRWWPAKVLSENDGTATIQYFGDHSQADNYKFKQCYIFADTEKDLRKKVGQASKSKKKRNTMEFECAFKVITIDFLLSEFHILLICSNEYQMIRLFLPLHFQEVAKYIENVERKYANSTKQPFVRASSKTKVITNVDQHLKQMFPAAFEQDDSMTSEDNKLQAAKASDNGGSFDGTAPHSPVSQGYESRSSDSEHSDDSVGAERQLPKFRTVRMNAEHQQYVADTPSAIGAGSTAGSKNEQQETRKRKVDNVMEKPAAKRMAKFPEKSKNDVEKIADKNDGERPSTSSKNHGAQSPATNNGNFKLLLDELAQISVKLAQNEQKKMELLALNEQEKEGLMAQKANIEAKLEKYNK